MREITLVFDCLDYKKIKEYLLSLKGIIEVNVINDNNFNIDIKYDNNLIGIKTLRAELLLFLDIIETPSLIAFDKHSNSELLQYKLIIDNLCCEYCLKDMIDDLLFINGIENVSTNFDYINKENVIINIEYDSNLISEKGLSKLEVKFNQE